MNVKIIREYKVSDDLNYQYLYYALIGDNRYLLCAVNNSLDGPVGEQGSIENLTRQIQKRVGKWKTTYLDDDGSFAREGEVELTDEEVGQICARR